MGFLDDLGLLARHVPGDARNALKGLLGDMPLTKALRGEAEVSANGLKNALMGMQVGPDAQGSYDAAMQIGPQAMGGLLGKIVYHGSPHKFDKFDASKIGTGEGAQAYGHGVYLADAEDVAKGYQKTLAYKAFDLGPEAEKRGLTLTAGARGEFHRQAAANSDPMRAARGLQNANISAREFPQEKLAELFDAFQKDGTGALYKADLPDEWIPKMLDWDKPLSQQPENVRKALANAPFETQGIGDPYGRDLLDMANSYAASGGVGSKAPSDGAALLRDLGITGVKYRDGQSRGAGNAGNAGKSAGKLSHNYVVFPGLEDKVKILERNGMPLGLLGQ